QAQTLLEDHAHDVLHLGLELVGQVLHRHAFGKRDDARHRRRCGRCRRHRRCFRATALAATASARARTEARAGWTIPGAWRAGALLVAGLPGARGRLTRLSERTSARADDARG